VPDFIVAWWTFITAELAKAPSLQHALAAYPVGCAIGIYWTQGLKRAQRRRKWGNRAFLTGFELRGISSVISGLVISLMGIAFYDWPRDQVLVHAILGGSLAPFIMWMILGVLGALAHYFPAVAAFRDAVKTGDRRRNPNGAVPPEGDRRDPEQTGEFWSN